MFMKSSRYIQLKESTSFAERETGIRFMPEYREAELSGCKRRWIWKRPRGIILQKGRSESRLPLLDPTRILRSLLYALSALLVMLGLGRMFGGPSAAAE